VGWTQVTILKNLYEIKARSGKKKNQTKQVIAKNNEVRDGGREKKVVPVGKSRAGVERGWGWINVRGEEQGNDSKPKSLHAIGGSRRGGFCGGNIDDQNVGGGGEGGVEMEMCWGG